MAIKTKAKRNSSLVRRQKISYSTKDQGSGGSRVLNLKDIGNDVQFFQPSDGRNAINIIPFIIKSKNHPLVKQGQMQIGELDYCLDIWTHRNVGPSESSVVCLKKTYGKACPICEEAEKLRKAGKKDEASALFSKRRVFYNIEDVRKKPGEIQIFEVSYHLFEKELLIEARNVEEDNEDGENENTISFADPEIGSIIKFRCMKVKQGGYEFNEFKSFAFAEREEPIDDDLLATAVSFDEHLNVLTYEQVQAILFGADEDDEETDEDDDEEEERPSRKKVSVIKAVKTEEPDDDEEDDEPVKRAPKSKNKSTVDVDDEDDETEEADEDQDEDNEEERPVKKSSSKAKPAAKGKCSYGHTFGKDADEHKECEDCEDWTNCIKAKK